MKTRILVPPGIGDVYWVLVKLKSFLEKNGLSNPELTIVSYPDGLNGHLRSIEFLEMVSWLTIGNPQFVPNDPALQAIWDEAYNGPGRSIFPGVMGYDYFMAYNGVINSGGYLETCDEYVCDWDFPVPMPDSIGLRDYNDKSKEFMLCFFPFIGTYESHENDFPIPLIAEAIKQFTAGSGLVPVFIGGKVEEVYNTKRYALIDAVGGIDLTGKTSFKEVLGMIQECSLIFGYHSGIPNLGAAFRKPTVLLWDTRFPGNTAYACVPPKVRDTTYRALTTRGLTVARVVRYLENACSL